MSEQENIREEATSIDLTDACKMAETYKIFNSRTGNISRAYLDMVTQRDAERERVAALESALREAIELCAACIIHSKSAEEVVATVNQLTAILNGAGNESEGA